jgi:Fe-S cluster biogenesis protein NfuA
MDTMRDRFTAVAARLLDDDMIASVLILHNLHPQGFRSRITAALERVRPYLGSHGGDIELLVADERSGTVRLRLAGSCDGCPSSLLTVKNAVEAAIMKVAPDVTSIEVQGMVDHSATVATALGGRQ